MSLYNIQIPANETVNHNLEAMAKQLYDYWFVQFDFPNAEGKPYKSSGGKMVWNEKLKREIPEGWCVSTIADLMPIITGKEDANFSVPNGKYKFFTCSKEVLNCNDAVFHGDAVLLSGNGDIHTKYYSGDFNAYQRTYVLIAETPLYFAATYFVCTNEIQRLLQRTSGSIIKFITKGMIERIPVLITDRIELYERLNLLLKQCLLNKSEIESLTKQRDELLPLLMNGQVSVNYDLSVVALLWRTPCRLVVGYRPFLICSRGEGVSPLGACSGRCNQSRTVEKRLRVFLLGLGHRPCSFGRGDDTEPKFVLTRESVCWK